MHAAGLIAIGGYLPAHPVPREKQRRLTEFLRRETPLARAYIDPIEQEGRLPGRVETNEQGWSGQPWYQAWLESLPEKKRSDPFAGAKERRRVPLDPTSVATSIHPHPMLSSDAETLAGAYAIINSGIDKASIDLVLVSSLVPDRHVPLNASLVQHKLSLPNAGAYNVDTCCSSFITMVELAESLVRSGVKNNVLVVASSLDSLINDHSTYHSPYTADGAAAAIVSRVEDGFGYLGSHSTSQGSRHQAIVFRTRSPLLHAQVSQGPSYEQEFVTFHDPALIKEIGAHAQQDVLRVAQGALERAGLQTSDIGFLVTHQPVAWAADAWRQAIGVPEDRFFQSFETIANVACASAPANLFLALEQQRIQPGDRLLMVSSGVGENHIAIVERVTPQLVRSVA
jgi:3-oxoacyl-[acyl-carrier-protein] synthase III